METINFNTTIEDVVHSKHLNISQEEIEKLSNETDVNVLKDEIAKLKKLIEVLTAILENKIEQNNSEVEEAKTAEITEEIPKEPLKVNQDNTIQESNQKETTKDSIKPEVGMKLPEQIAIITQKGLIAIDNTEVLAVSEDGTQITIGNSEQSVVVEPDTFDELMKPSEKINENKEAYNKLPETMYNDFFNPREPNCADNFRHNLSVYCREKANSPIDALELAKQLIQNMPKNEQKRTKNLIEKCRKPWQNINEALIEIYEDAVKEVPLNEQWIKNNAPGKYIPRQLTDVITSEGNKIDRDSDLKIGSVLNDVVLTNNKVFGKGKEKINVGELKIVAASKENNSITLMSKDKSYYELPRDTVLAAYNHNLITKNKNHSIEIER